MTTEKTGVLEKKTYDDLVTLAMEALDGVEEQRLAIALCVLLDVLVIWSDEHDAYLVYWPNDEDDEVEEVKINV